MLFSSLTFLCFFLPAAACLHFIMPKRLKNALLLFASVFFYAWGEIGYLPLVLVSMGLNFVFGLGAASQRKGLRRAALFLSLAVNFGALVYFKYAAFLMETVGLGAYAPQAALPLGISFYTFQTQAYVADVYRGKTPPEKKFIDYAAFILLFPQLIAGPIVLYEDVRRELKNRTADAKALEEGMAAFLTGLAAKVLLANPLGAVWEQLHALAAPSAPAAWLSVIAFGLQIYFDFHGYSLMAIGMGRMFGFHFPRNFDHPYAAASVQMFWRRWHMTLGGWFREYVYLPLGGSRCGRFKTLRNLFIVWALTGLWHGASWNFAAWGLWYFVFLALEHFCIGGFLKKHRGIGHVYTLLVVLLGWVLFASETLGDAMRLLGQMFSLRIGADVLFPLRESAVLLLIAFLCCVPRVCRGVSGFLKKHALMRAAILLAVLVLCIAALTAEAYNPFLYFRF